MSQWAMTRVRSRLSIATTWTFRGDVQKYWVFNGPDKVRHRQRLVRVEKGINVGENNVSSHWRLVLEL